MAPQTWSQDTAHKKQSLKKQLKSKLAHIQEIAFLFRSPKGRSPDEQLQQDALRHNISTKNKCRGQNQA